MKESLTEGTKLGHYRILGKLGAGGMGEIYLAEDTLLNRRVAIKLLLLDAASDPQAKKRLTREAQAAAALDHPAICAIHEVREEQEHSFIVMQYVEGETLAARLRKSPLQISEAIDFALQIAKALAEAHSHGIVHRDVKPQNIMITDRGHVKVLDFGLAKQTNIADTENSFVETRSSLTAPGVVLGTVPYMSPEQVRGEELDATSDIFSLGIVMYEMISGKQPFGAKTAAEVISAILTSEPPSLTTYASGVPPELLRIVDRCLKKDRRQRYPKTSELVADLEEVKTQPHPVQPSASIAVLPFVNMSADRENEYFCDGLAEELINAFTKVERLSVVARTSAFSFKGKDMDVRDIGRKLNVGAVLEGSVRKAGNRLRITAQLINVADGYHIWSERYDRQLEDVFDIQDEISLAIVDKLKVKLFGGEKAAVLKRYTDNTEAHDLYLKGRYFWFQFNPESWIKSRKCFEKALQKDPKFALAYPGLADAIVASAVFTSPKEVIPKAKEVVQQAMQLDPSMAEAWCSSAAIKIFYDLDIEGAASDCVRSLELNPRYVLVRDLHNYCLSSLGKHEEALQQISRSCELDPLSGYFNASWGSSLYNARRYDEAEKQLLKGADLDPANIWAHMWLTDLYEQQARYAEAMHHRQKLLNVTGRGELAVELGREFRRSGYEGVLLKYLDALHNWSRVQYVAPLDFAATYVRLGDTEKALDWLEKAYEDRTMYLCFLKVRPAWDSLRANPRFTALLQRMNL